VGRAGGKERLVGAVRARRDLSHHRRVRVLRGGTARSRGTSSGVRGLVSLGFCLVRATHQDRRTPSTASSAPQSGVCIARPRALVPRAGPAAYRAWVGRAKPGVANAPLSPGRAGAPLEMNRDGRVRRGRASGDARSSSRARRTSGRGAAVRDSQASQAVRAGRRRRIDTRGCWSARASIQTGPRILSSALTRLRCRTSPEHHGRCHRRPRFPDLRAPHGDASSSCRRGRPPRGARRRRSCLRGGASGARDHARFLGSARPSSRPDRDGRSPAPPSS